MESTVPLPTLLVHLVQQQGPLSFRQLEASVLQTGYNLMSGELLACLLQLLDTDQLTLTDTLAYVTK